MSSLMSVACLRHCQKHVFLRIYIFIIFRKNCHRNRNGFLVYVVKIGRLLSLVISKDDMKYEFADCSY